MGPGADSETAAGLPGVGEPFDGWLIEAALGRGAMGAVFRASHEAKGLHAALKILPGQADRELFGRFRREVQVMGRLSHPSLARILHEALDHDPPYFAMELLEGGDLLTRIQEVSDSGRGGLPPSFVTRLGLQLLDGLAEAHGEGILHRDIKPSNILFAARDQAKLADFGLAKAVDMTSLTRDFGLRGTLPYMAPEVLRGGKESPSSDLYQLGVTLYQAATTELPFDIETLHRVLAGESMPPLPRRTEGTMTPRLHAALAALTAADPAERPASAREAAELFRPRVTGATPVRSRVVSRATRAAASPTATALRNVPPWFFPALPVAFLALAVLAVTAFRPSQPARPADAPEDGGARVASGSSGRGSAVSSASANAPAPLSLLQALESALAAERSLGAELLPWRTAAGAPCVLARVFVVNAPSIVRARFRCTTPAPRAGAAAASAGPEIALEVDDPRDLRKLGRPAPAEGGGHGWILPVDPGWLREGFNRFTIAAPETEARAMLASLEIERAAGFPANTRPSADRLAAALCPPHTKTLHEAMTLCVAANFSSSLAMARAVLEKSPDCGEARIVISRALNRVLEIRSESRVSGLLASFTMLTVSSDLDRIPSPQLMDESDRQLDIVARRYPSWDRVWHQYGEHFERRRAWEQARRAARWRTVLGPALPDPGEALANYELGRALQTGARQRGVSWVRGVHTGLAHVEHAAALREKARTTGSETDFIRGRLYLLLGRLPEARVFLERATRSTKTQVDARRVLASLARGETTTR